MSSQTSSRSIAQLVSGRLGFESRLNLFFFSFSCFRLLFYNGLNLSPPVRIIALLGIRSRRPLHGWPMFLRPPVKFCRPEVWSHFPQLWSKFNWGLQTYVDIRFNLGDLIALVSKPSIIDCDVATAWDGKISLAQFLTWSNSTFFFWNASRSEIILKLL